MGVIGMVAGADFGIMPGMTETITITKTETGFAIQQNSIRNGEPFELNWEHTGEDFTVCVYGDGKISIAEYNAQLES